jgi:hypothetical protein
MRISLQKQNILYQSVTQIVIILLVLLFKDHCSIFRGDSLSSSHFFTHSVSQSRHVFSNHTIYPILCTQKTPNNPYNPIPSIPYHPSHTIPHTIPYHPMFTHMFTSLFTPMLTHMFTHMSTHMFTNMFTLLFTLGWLRLVKCSCGFTATGLSHSTILD